MEEKELPDDSKVGDEVVPKSKQGIVIAVLVFAVLILAGSLIYTIAGKKKDVSEEPKSEIVNTDENEKTQASESAQNVPIANTEGTSSSTQTSDQTADSAQSGSSAGSGVTKKADLYVSEYGFSEDPKSGEEFTVKIKIGNKGDADAGSFHWEWWATHSKADCDGKVDGLKIGKTKTVECKFTYSSWATYETKAVVDSENEIDESNESNNTAKKQVIPIHETAKADLYVSDYYFNHAPKSGEAFTVNITVYNKGGTATGSFWWEWWPVAANKSCRAKIDNLLPNGGEVVSCTYTYSSWANYLTKAVVDADNEVDESNESNNTYTKYVIPIH